jgi:hypothetical protein
MQIIDRLRHKERTLNVSFHVIILDSHYSPMQKDSIFSPLKALLTTRTVRSQIAITNLYTNRSLTNDLVNGWCDGSEGAGQQKQELCEKYKRMAGEQDQPFSDACDRLQGLKMPDADKDKFGSLRPMQLSLDLQTFDVPLAFSLSRNANVVVDAFSADTVCDADRTGRRSALTPASRSMLDRWQCGIDQLCNGFNVLSPNE